MSRTLVRAAVVADRRVTGLSPQVLAELDAELGPRWQARQDARLADRPCQRAVGAGARYQLVFIDRLLVTLVHLRHGVTHDVLPRGYEQARPWELKRLRLFAIPARAARTGRRRLLHLAATAPFTALALQALAALTRLPALPRVASG